jgi:hypothetical protein
MPDLISMGRTCRFMRRLCQGVIRRRLRTILEPWTGQYYTPFLALCHRVGCIITGSCALAMLTARHVTASRDLNLVAPAQAFDFIHEFLHVTLRYQFVADGCHPVMSSVVGRFHRYKTGKQTITLSIAKDRMHVLHVVLNAPSTADMIFMTGGGIACFYFDWLREGISVCSRSADHIPRGEQLGSVGKINSDLCLQRGTYFLRTECGSVCPTFWQHVDSFDRTLRVTWDEQLSIDSVLSNADVEWRLNTYCTNLSCTYRMSVMASNSDSLGANTGM